MKSEMHLHAVIERVWRCNVMLRSNMIGGELEVVDLEALDREQGTMEAETISLFNL